MQAIKNHFNSDSRAVHMRWASSVIRGDFYPMFIWNLQSHFNQKVCYVAGKNCFDQVVFKTLHYLIIILKKKKSTVQRKLYPNLPGWHTCTCSYGKSPSHVGEIPAKSNEIPTGGLAHFSYEHIIFLQGFFKEAEISPGRASSPNRVSSHSYE